jgi:hypothetical protein
LSTPIEIAPQKLQTAANIIPSFNLSAPVETLAVIAFGASVHPFTKITPNISKTETANPFLSVNRIFQKSNMLISASTPY